MKCLFLATALLCSIAQSNEIALTFDDAPRGDTHVFSGTERAEKIVEALKARRAAFFCNSKQLNSESVERLKFYAKNGHLLANHSHSHQNIRKLPVTEYISDIESAHQKLTPLPNFKKWFRFPYLREGEQNPIAMPFVRI